MLAKKVLIQLERRVCESFENFSRTLSSTHPTIANFLQKEDMNGHPQQMKDHE